MPKTAEWTAANKAFAARFGGWFSAKVREFSFPELAKKSGVATATIYGYASGRRAPSLHELSKILRAAGVESIELRELAEME